MEGDGYSVETQEIEEIDRIRGGLTVYGAWHLLRYPLLELAWGVGISANEASRRTGISRNTVQAAYRRFAAVVADGSISREG